ncbi:MurR/RpiR family transcriptional regulator [Tatumella sp. UBA2305]|uniref:MurR/RpiR family transcriptional regulator n=1 Tax=Tatumella sp. UBA2305 TaxID=1947647 RepID=UPI0025EA73BE|nr:hypothetical protein [Tatumella sp. UBA2305]
MNYYHSPVYIKLSEYLFYCRKKSVNVNIALVMLQKIREFPAIYIEEIALLANTTPASVTRFCKILGYSRFQTLKQDLQPFFTPSPELSVSSVDPAAREIDMLQKIHQHMPLALCREIAVALRDSRHLLILSTDYSFMPSNLLREALANDRRRVYQLHRQSDSSLLAKFMAVCDTLILIDLTGQWLRQHPELFTALSEKISVCFTANPGPALPDVFSFVIDLTIIPDFFSSNYFSCQVMTSTVFRIINDVERMS